MLDTALRLKESAQKTYATNPNAQPVIPELSKDKVREIIAKRAAKEFSSGDVVTLGIGLPTAVADYVPSGVQVIFQSENGLLGDWKNSTNPNADKRIINAGGVCVDVQEGASFYDTAMALTMMRGGHIDVTILGALQVDEEGSIASWMIPNKFVPGMGGAMDLVIGSKRVIVAMEHSSKGEVKIVKKCTLPLTAYKEVDVIITERCVFKVTSAGLVLTDINPMFSVNDIRESVTADFVVSDKPAYMEI